MNESEKGDYKIKEIYKRRMTVSEATRHFIYIEAGEIWKFFPCRKERFKVRIGGRKFDVEIDDGNRMWAASFRDYIEFKKGNVLVFKKNRDDSFTLSLEK